MCARACARRPRQRGRMTRDAGGRKEVSEKYDPISLYQSHLIGNLYKQRPGWL